jgi:hypothetical protein
MKVTAPFNRLKQLQNGASNAIFGKTLKVDQR